MKVRKHSISRAIFEPVDKWLESLDLFRKQVPRDGSCLFRALAEQMCLSQGHHKQIRHLALDYMLLHKNFFQMHLSEPLENYVKRMRSPMEFGGRLEIVALSLIFKVDCLVYSDVDSPPINVTGFGFPSIVLLYHCASNHYDIIYKKKYTALAGFCQALIYKALYTKVLGTTEVMSVVDQMLHDPNSCFRKDSVNSEGQEMDILRIVEQVEAVKTSDNVFNNSFDLGSPDKGLNPPFPYRVAKALDPDIYRNCDYDIWMALKREARFGPYDLKGLQIGVKVVIKAHLYTESPNKNGSSEPGLLELTPNLPAKILHGHIQSMAENQGPVEVFVEELGQRITVPYVWLEKMASTPTKSSADESPLFLAGSPPSYKVLSALARKGAALPLPDVSYCPVGKVGRKKSTSISLPLCIKPPKGKNIQVQRENKIAQARSRPWDIPGRVTTTSMEPPLPLPASQESSSVCLNFENCCNWNNVDTTEAYPVDASPQGGVAPPCMDVDCRGECGGGSLFACPSVSPEMFGYPVDGCYPYPSFVPYPPPQFFVYGGVNEFSQSLPTPTNFIPGTTKDIPYQEAASLCQYPFMYPVMEPGMYYPTVPLANSAELYPMDSNYV